MAHRPVAAAEPGAPGTVTALLAAWGDGDRAALDALLPAVYDELRRHAAHALRGEGPGHVLQPTALVHEAYLRLADQRHARWDGRAHFFGAAAAVMRRILVDHARRRRAHKRGGDAPAVTLSPDAPAPEPAVDVLALDDALARLARLDARQARVVELRYFGGLSVEETAVALGTSPATVKREWATARLWLRRAPAPRAPSRRARRRPPTCNARRPGRRARRGTLGGGGAVGEHGQGPAGAGARRRVGTRAGAAAARLSPVALAGLAAGCLGVQPVHFVKAPVRDDRPTGARKTTRGPAYAPNAALPAAADPASDWGTYNGPPTGTRFSPLAELTPATVGDLRLACAFETGERTSMQSGPVVVGGVLYVTSATRTYALDAATCRRRWTHTYKYYPAPPFDLRTNRGVAYVDAGPPGAPRPVLVRGANDGRVYAIDARTGRQVWNVRAGDVARGETFPAAPVAYRGPDGRALVLLGNAGGDNYAVTGRLMAFDAATGARVWTFEFVPRAGAPNATWPAETDRVPRAGATTWTTYTLDPATGTVYVPTGNATPNFVPALRPGQNDYTNSVVALDARTGAFRAAYKVLALDSHDYDVAAAPVLADVPGAGPTVAVAGKDGYLHAFARAAEAPNGTASAAAGGVRRWRTPVTTLLNDTVVPTPAGVRFCPGVQGGAEWNGPAYDAARGVFVVGAVDWCTTVKAEPPEEVKGRVGVPWTGSAHLVEPFGHMDPRRDARGWVTAVDAATGAVRWRVRAPAPVVAGVTATAGGLTFTADQSGRVYAFETATGAVRWQADAGQPVGGGVVTYAVGGRQYVAVASGLHAPLAWRVTSSPARVLVFARGGPGR